MPEIHFEWNKKKNEANLKKHGISFEEAKSVFYDQNAIEFFDEEHSRDEQRFLLLGFSDKLRLLLISHCFRKSNSRIRIISARKATKNEAKYYRR
jgi:uncharacterized DUF497 family protein